MVSAQTFVAYHDFFGIYCEVSDAVSSVGGEELHLLGERNGSSTYCIAVITSKFGTACL